MRSVANPPLLLLVSIAIFALFFTGFLSTAPNRLLSGPALNWWDIPIPSVLKFGFAGALAPLVFAAFRRSSRALDLLALCAASLALLLLAACAGVGAARLALKATPAARVMLGPGFWMMLFVFSLAIVNALQRLRAGSAIRVGVATGLVAVLACLAWSGSLDSLSLARELSSHRSQFASALLRHVVLVGCTLGLALAMGVPLGLAIQRRAVWRGPVFGVLNVLQTVPSVALFGLLIAPLAAFGLSGIGMVPALIALVIYALLPVVRGLVAGLDGADSAMLEAASGMGMTPRQILVSVALPLAAPALLAGLRIVTVQTVGLAVVAALIGAGGLGDFVFQGLGQYAVDLVLLGALPAIILALAADFVLQLAASPFRARLA